MSLDERLVAFLEELDWEENCELKADTSLIKSGLLDSLNLFKLAAWIQEEISSQIDLTEFNLVEEWDTITDILKFIEKHQFACQPLKERGL
ncbi:MAG: acyl carrier protein [Symploca sp. SIO2C1]|nr:acyl carrier protein [Symploca sp. SIO2C1]